MPQPLPRAFRRKLQALDSAKVARIVGVVDAKAATDSSAGATSGGDERRLRGLPAIGRGVQGAIRGTRPDVALFAKEQRRGR